MRPSISPVLVAILLTAFLLPPCYVASVGPAIWLRDRKIISQETMLAIYGPVAWSIEHVPVLGGMINRYCRLWHSPEKWPATSATNSSQN